MASLHAVLPAPKSVASHQATVLTTGAAVAQVAEVLRGEPGFASVQFTTSSGGSGTHLLHRPLATITYSEGSALIVGPGGSAKVTARGFDILQAALQAWRNPQGALLVGFLSYDLASELEDVGPAPVADFVFPSLHFGLFDSALTFENGRWSFSATDAWRDIDGKIIERVARAIDRADSIEETPLRSGAVVSRPDRNAFETAVARIVQTIHAGDIFQTNLCRCLEAPLDSGAAWTLYRRMRAISPSRYEAFLRIDRERSVLSISPESFLRVEDRCVESAPIKGTRPRAKAPAEDRALSEDLLTSEKDRAELAMIVDVVRNDLARVCETGSVKVIRHAELMSLPTVHHLFSTIRGRLRNGAGPVELLKAAFPPASISGAPKIEAIRVAMREEGQLRGPCMGAIGWISLDGRMELSVAIRTAFVSGGSVRYYAGCGITAGSVPSAEFTESRHKAAAFVRALGTDAA